MHATEVDLTKEEIKFNPYSPEFHENPYKLYERLRREAPVLEISDSMYMVTRYKDIRTIMSDSSASVRYIPDSVVELSKGDIPNLIALGQSAIVFTDPPEHSRLRKLMNKAFNRNRINNFKGLIEDTVSSLLVDKVNGVEFDFMGDVAHLVPLVTISKLFGVEENRMEELDENLMFLRQILDPTLHTGRRIKKFESTLEECVVYFEGLIGDARKENKDNILSSLIDASIGDDVLSDSEIIIGCVLTYIAGHETTKGVIGSGVLAFSENPEQWGRLRSDEKLLEQSIEEVLRFESPLQQTMRVLTEDIDVSGATLKKGSKLLLCMGSGNRDGEIFEHPDQFNIDRVQHENLAFGIGMHNCIGKHLAKMEAEMVFSFLLKHVKRFKLSKSNHPDWTNLGVITRSLKTLNISLHS